MILNQPEQPRRSDARVAALAAAIHDVRAMREPADLFAPPAQTRSRLGVAFSFGVLAVGCIAALFVVFSDGPGIAGAPVASAGAAAQTAAAVAAAPPLELVALTSDRDADRLVVRGTVRNPSAGTNLARLTAVVLLFDRNGASVANGRADVDAAMLAPGMEAPFTVALPASTDVSRYRISFRTTEPTDRIVPHVDRRPRAIAQVTQP